MTYANTSPPAPIIREPRDDGQIVNGADVHMVTDPMEDADEGDEHLCTDWKIEDLSTSEIVWSSTCIDDLEMTHIHLGDGTFSGSHQGRTDLLPERDFVLRVRHRDDSGDAETEWSDWSARTFRTAELSRVAALELSMIAEHPAPRWLDQNGLTFAWNAGREALLRLESSEATPLLEAAVSSEGQLEWQAFPPLHDHHPVRVLIDNSAAAEATILPATNLFVYDESGREHPIYLPPLHLAAGQRVAYWISGNGGSHDAEPAQSEPDFSRIARSAPVPWRVLQEGFVVENVATGFQLPVGIAFHPQPGPDPDDPFFYVAELYGTIKVVTRSGEVRDFAANLLNFEVTPKFPGSGEMGMPGILVEPESGDLFVSALYYHETDDALYPRVYRLRSQDGGRTESSRTVLLDMKGEKQGASHQISNLSIGPDGKLYIHVADGNSIAASKNLDSFRGKILRVELDGTPPEDNPFYDGPLFTARDYVYARGFRNPFGGGWRGADGQLYVVENGPKVDRLARILSGEDYGWDGSDESMWTGAAWIWQKAHAPVNLTFIEPDRFGGSGFPPSKWDHAFVSESGATWSTGPISNGKRLVEFVFSPSGELVMAPTRVIEYSGTGKGTICALAAGPDGLYFSDLYADSSFSNAGARGANILRLRWVGTATFMADVEEISEEGIRVSFTDTSPLEAPLSWKWDFGDGASSTERHPTHTYARPGVYPVRLAVTSASGLSERTTRSLFAATTGEGLDVRLYSDEAMSELLEESREAVDFSSADRPLGSARWTGWIRPRFSQSYNLTIQTDGGARMRVGQRMLIDDWDREGLGEKTGTINLDAGRFYEIEIEFRPSGPDSLIRLFWESETQRRELVPATSLYTDLQPPSSRSRRAPKRP